MPKIQFEIPEETNKKIRHYMAEENIFSKRIAVIQLLNKALR